MMNRRAIDSWQRGVSDLIFAFFAKSTARTQKLLSSLGTDTPILMSSAAWVGETTAVKKAAILRQGCRLDQVAAKGVLTRLKKIEWHGREIWNALAWMVSGAIPKSSRGLEVQLNLAVPE
jgi:hypothetical protein